MKEFRQVLKVVVLYLIPAAVAVLVGCLSTGIKFDDPSLETKVTAAICLGFLAGMFLMANIGLFVWPEIEWRLATPAERAAADKAEEAFRRIMEDPVTRERWINEQSIGSFFGGAALIGICQRYPVKKTDNPPQP